MLENSKSKLCTLKLMENFQSNESRGYLNWFAKVFFSLFINKTFFFSTDTILKKKALNKRL